MSNVQRQSCWVAELTPSGRGAVATIAVWGAAATELLQACFKPRGRERLAATPPGGVRFGDWYCADQTSEEVVVCRRAAEEWEVHCHGGRAAPSAIVAMLVHRGAQACESATWLVRHTLDTLEWESQIALMAAPTERTAAILLDQSRGALRDCIARVIRFLNSGDTSSASRMLRRLRQLSAVGQHLCRPWRVAVVGPANAGKSSLVNRLSGYQRAIVMDEPGTTRDVLAAQVAFDGWPVELIDTAGLRATRDPVERQGVELAIQQARDADLTIVLMDAMRLNADLGSDAVRTPGALLDSNTLLDPGLLVGRDVKPDLGPDAGGGSGIGPEAVTETSLPVTDSRLLVANKVDLYTGPALSCDLCISAKTGQGIGELVSLLLRRLTREVHPGPGEAVPFHPRHLRAITAAGQLLEAGDPAGASRVLVEFLAYAPPPRSTGEFR